MDKFALFDADGFPTAFYSSEIHGDNMPVGVVEITEVQWREFLENPGLRKWLNGRAVEYTPPPIDIPDPVTIVYSVDLWSRMTNAEADQVGAAMEAQPFRIRKIFESASSFRSDHELWTLLVQIATTLFGEDRAAQILAPSQQ